MSPDALHELEVAEAGALIAARRVSCVELATAVLDRIAAVEPAVGAYALAEPRDAVLARARALDGLLRQGRSLGPLHGIPIAIKDVVFVAGRRTEAGSALYAGFTPPVDATLVTALERGGATLVGKTTTWELASGAAPRTANPWDLARTPGGSSSGSAAAVAAGEALAAIGTDTRWSVRGPAAFCGLTGTRPTYGTISRFGILALSFTIDCVGPLTRSALDAALVIDAVAGHDARDPETRRVAPRALAPALERASAGARPLAGMALGVPAPEDPLAADVGPEACAAFGEALEVVRALGAEVRPLRTAVLPPPLTTLASLSTPIVAAEVAAAQHRNWEERAEAFSLPYRRQVATGALLPASGYVLAQQARTLWADGFLRSLAGVDAFLHPVDGIAPIADPPPARPSTGSPWIPWSLAGAPSVAVPVGRSAVEGMPLAMGVAGLPGRDLEVLRVAHAFQRATTHHRARATLTER